LIEFPRRGNAQSLSCPDIIRPSDVLVLFWVRRCHLWQFALLGKVGHGYRGPGRTVRQVILQLDIIPSILFDWLRWPTLLQEPRIDFPEAFFKVSQPDNDDADVDESEVGDDGEDVDDQLLSEFQVLDVDGVQPTLSTAADSEEESIDSGDVVKTGEDCESE
jgi:hypothetical protein